MAVSYPSKSESTAAMWSLSFYLLRTAPAPSRAPRTPSFQISTTDRTHSYIVPPRNYSARKGWTLHCMVALIVWTVVYGRVAKWRPEATSH